MIPDYNIIICALTIYNVTQTELFQRGAAYIIDIRCLVYTERYETFFIVVLSACETIPKPLL